MTILTRIGPLVLLATTCLAGAAAAQTELSLWYHGAGNEVERNDPHRQIVDDFNASQADWKVAIEQFPQAAYNDSVDRGGAVGRAAGHPRRRRADHAELGLGGVSRAADRSTRRSSRASCRAPIGKWNDQIYSVGFWDAALAMFARKSVLEENGIRIPTLDEPWTGEEFDAVLVTLKDSGKYEYPLNIGMADKGEWYPYAFLPFL